MEGAAMIFALFGMTASSFLFVYMIGFVLRIFQGDESHEDREAHREMAVIVEEAPRSKGDSVVVEMPNGYICIGVEEDLDASKKMSCNSQI